MIAKHNVEAHRNRRRMAIADAGIQITSTHSDKVSLKYRNGIVKVILAGLEIQRS
jgi:hypothetical protein